jgi:hypothetical protein
VQDNTAPADFEYAAFTTRELPVAKTLLSPRLSIFLCDSEELIGAVRNGPTEIESGEVILPEMQSESSSEFRAAHMYTFLCDLQRLLLPTDKL